MNTEIKRSHKSSKWPYGIILALGIFITGIVSAVTVMMNREVPLISADYYEQEIAYQDRIEDEKRVLTQGKTPTVIQENDQGVWVAFVGVDALVPAEGKITFFRHSNAKSDFSHPIRLNSEGRQWIQLKDAAKGLWQVEFLWKEGNQSYYHETKLTL